MPPRRLSDTHLLVGAGVLTLLLAATAALIAPPAGGGADRPSSFSTGPGGGKAAFLTLIRLGYDVERSYEPMTAVRAEPARTTLIVTGPRAPSEGDRRALQSFLERGGTVLLVGVQGADFLGVSGAAAPLPFARPATHRAAVPSPLARHAPEITMVPSARPPQFDAGWVAVFTAAGDQPVVAVARRGRGRAIWWASPTPLTNAHIAAGGNLQLLLNTVGVSEAGKVLWDEHYHGHSRSLWSYAAGTPLPWMGAQLALVAAALFAGYSRRRGPVRSKAVDPRTSALEFIDMLRALYSRAASAPVPVAAAHRRLRRVVSSALGVPADSPDETIARVMAAKGIASFDDVRRTLEASARAAGNASLSGQEALKLTGELQRLSAAVTRRRQ